MEITLEFKAEEITKIISETICNHIGIDADKSFMLMPSQYRPCGISNWQLSIKGKEYPLDKTSIESIRISVLNAIKK